MQILILKRIEFYTGKVALVLFFNLTTPQNGDQREKTDLFTRKLLLKNSNDYQLKVPISKSVFSSL
jgi:hypothetical protein